MHWDKLEDSARQQLRDLAWSGVKSAAEKCTESALVVPSNILSVLQQKGATFVTLMKHNDLRGCIGTLEAWRPVADDVLHNGYAAACRDPRFFSVELDELPLLTMEISLLTEPEFLCVENEEALLAALRPGIDGVILSAAGRRATYLPSVWGQLPDPQQFIQQLKIKAGLSADYWSDDVRIECYQVLKI